MPPVAPRTLQRPIQVVRAKVEGEVGRVNDRSRSRSEFASFKFGPLAQIVEFSASYSLTLFKLIGDVEGIQKYALSPV